MRKTSIFVLLVLLFVLAQAGLGGDPAQAQQSQPLRVDLILPPDKYLSPGATITGRVILKQPQQKIDPQAIAAALQGLRVQVGKQEGGKQNVPVNKDGLFVFKLPLEAQNVLVRVYDPKYDDPIRFIGEVPAGMPPMYDENGRLIAVPAPDLAYQEYLRQQRLALETGIYFEAPPEAQPDRPYTITGSMLGGGNGLDIAGRFGPHDASLLWHVAIKEDVFAAAFDASAVQPGPQIFSLLKNGKVIAGAKVKGLPSTGLAQKETEARSAGQSGQSGGPANALLGRLKSALDKRAEILQRSLATAPLPTSQKTTPVNVSLVLPAQATGVISGTVMTEKDHPERFKNIPGLQVVDLGQMPLMTGNDGKPYLGNIVVETGNHISILPGDTAVFTLVLQPNPGFVGTITLTLGSLDLTDPHTVNQIQMLQQQGQLGGSLSGTPGVPAGGTLDLQPVNIHQAQVSLHAQDPSKINVTPARVGLAQLSTSPVSFANEVAHVRGAGRFSGDSNKLLVSLAGQPVTPIAANQDGFFYQLPAGTKPGLNELVFADQGPNGWFAASTMIGVVQLITGIDQPNLLKGQRTNGHVGLNVGKQEGFDVLTLPAEGFQAPQLAGHTWLGDPELVDPSEIQKAVPDFRPPVPLTGIGASTAAGFVFLAIQNQSPTVISIAGFKGITRFWYLALKELPFQTILPIQSRSGGVFDISVIAKAFFPPAGCQEYQIPPELVQQLELAYQGSPTPQASVPTASWQPPKAAYQGPPTGLDRGAATPPVYAPMPALHPSAPEPSFLAYCCSAPYQPPPATPPVIVEEPLPPAHIGPPLQISTLEGSLQIHPPRSAPMDFDVESHPRNVSPPVNPSASNLSLNTTGGSVHAEPKPVHTPEPGAVTGSGVPPKNPSGPASGQPQASILTPSTPSSAGPKVPGKPGWMPPTLKRAITANDATFRWRMNEIPVEGVKGLPDFSVPFGPGSQQPIVVAALTTADPQALQQLRRAAGQPQNCSFKTSSTGRAGSVHDSFNFQNCLITEIGLPALDAAVKDATKMTVKVVPELRENISRPSISTANPEPVGPAPEKKEKLWAPANFRLEIPGTAALNVNKIEGLPSPDQVASGDWSAGLTLVGPGTRTRSEMLEWYQQVLKGPKPQPQSCSIVMNYPLPGGTGSRQYDFFDCLLTGYSMTCLDAETSQGCEERVTIRIRDSLEFRN